MKIKNIALLALVISILAIAIGCENREYQKDEGATSQSTKIENKISDTEIVSSIPKDYSPNDAEKNGDLVNVHGKYRNLEKLDQFMIKMKNAENAVLQVTEYTKEGDPIIKRLVYNGKIVNYIYDSSRDDFAGSGKGMKVFEGNAIVGEPTTKINGRNTYNYEIYYLIGETNSIGKKEIFRILSK